MTGDPEPVTPGQRGLWFLHLLAPGDPAYNSCTAIELAGPLSVPALRAAVAQIGNRHELLRAVVSDVDGVPRQTFLPAVPSLHLVDLAAMPEDGRRAEADRQLRGLAGLPFDLRTGPPARWVLLRFGPERHLLVLDVHHIVFDHESFAVVCDELERGYSAAVHGGPLPWDVAPGGDARLVADAWGSGGHSAQSLAFWRARLAGAPPYTGIFADDHDGGDGTNGADPVHQVVAYDNADLARLAALCAAEGATSFMAMLAVLACLISRYTGTRDVVIGTAVSLRDPVEHSATVGLLVNVLPLRLRLDGRPSFRSVLRLARDAVLDALDHRLVPLHRVVESAAGSRRAEGTPPFQALLTYQRQGRPPRLPGLTSLARPVPAASAKHELAVTMTESQTGLAVALEGDPRRCAPPRLAAFGRHLVSFVARVGRDPDAPVASVDLLGPAELVEASGLASGPRVPRTPPACLAGLLAAAVRDHPDGVAVLAIDGDGDRTHRSYTDVHRAARALAGALRDRGVRPDRAVGVLLRSGADLPIAHLAVLLAGGAVLPLDPDDADELLARNLADSGADLVVTGPEFRERCARLGVPVIAADDWPSTGGPAPMRAHPDQAAYVLYRDGAGVVVTHRAVVNRLLWMRDAMPVRPGERVLGAAPAGSPAPGAELFWPLSGGGCLVIAPPGAHHDPRDLVRALERERIGCALFAPRGLASVLNDIESVGVPPASLRLIGCGGADVAPELTERAAAVLDAEVHHIFGYADASGAFASRRAGGRRRGPFTIGRPIPGAECHVLDEDLRSVPESAVGELYMGGDCLSRGYHNRPGRTAATFRPATDRPGARLYATGDRARRMRDGPAYPGGPTYPGQPPHPGQPGVARPAPGGDPQTRPLNDLERRLVAAWCGVLGVADVGVNEGFFEVGGTSLTMLQLHRRLVADVAPGLSLRELFRFPTVAALAGHLTGGATATGVDATRVVARAERRRAAMTAVGPSGSRRHPDGGSADG